MVTGWMKRALGSDRTLFFVSKLLSCLMSWLSATGQKNVLFHSVQTAQCSPYYPIVIAGSHLMHERESFVAYTGERKKMYLNLLPPGRGTLSLALTHTLPFKSVFHALFPIIKDDMKCHGRKVSSLLVACLARIDFSVCGPHRLGFS